MQTNNHKTRDYGAVLDAEFGTPGTDKFAASIEDARNFYTAQILHDARREAQMTQSQLAEKVNVTKSYISRLENGYIVPSVSMFFRIIDALGMRVEIVRPVAAFMT